MLPYQKALTGHILVDPRELFGQILNFAHEVVAVFARFTGQVVP